jgi:glycosyltransferase involved in cell wall biosynthesis
MRLLFLSMHYAPEPCDTRTSTLARDMAALGHQCTALTSFPNYPFGRTYDGWRQSVWKVTQEEGVRLVRVPMLPDHSRNAKRRALSYLSFMASAGTLGNLKVSRADVLWIHHPPLSTAIAGRFLAMSRRMPYVLEIHDVWPDTLVSTGMVQEGRVTAAIGTVCRKLYRNASAIVVTSEGMRRRVVGNGAPSEKVIVLPQWADETIYEPATPDPEFAARHGLSNAFNVVFAGNLGAAQGLHTVLDAAKLLTDLHHVRLVLVGDGMDAPLLRARVDREAISNVRFLGHHAAQQMPQFYAWASALLIHLKADPLFADTIPSKTQVYLASGKPILCGVNGDAGCIVRESGAGVVFEPENPEAMAHAIRRLATAPPEVLQEMACRAREAYVRKFSRKATLEKYEQLFQWVSQPERARARQDLASIGTQVVP